MIQVGVVGTGAIGQHHVRNYADMKNVELAGIADLDKRRAERLAEEYNTVPYTDFEELLELDLDAVSIAVPTSLHKKIALPAIEKGINVLVEKPIADTLENADEMIERAKEKNVKLMVGHIERFNPAIISLKESIEEGALGDIVSISATRIGPYNPRIRDVGIILDLAVHDIDVMQYLYREKVKNVYASAGSIFNKYEDYAVIHLNFSNGYSGVVESNWLSPHKVRKLMAVGTKGIACVDYIQSSLKVYDNEWEMDAKIDKREPLRVELEHFVDCVEYDRQPTISGKDGRHVLEVALTAIKSYKCRQVVEISNVRGTGSQKFYKKHTPSKIMVVDDEPDFVYMLKNLLGREGYDVTEAYSGRECLQKIEKIRPDIVLLDIVMPDMDGWEVCKKIKENGWMNSISVSMLSVRESLKDRKRSLDYAHADEHLTKPIDSKELVGAVKTLLEKAYN